MVVWIEICVRTFYNWHLTVTTCVVVWIEMMCMPGSPTTSAVTTCVVVWIEILTATPPV